MGRRLGPYPPLPFPRPMPIPSRAHLVWLGPRLSPLAYVSVRSALAEGGFEAVTLHVDTPAIAGTPLVRDLVGRPGFELAPVDVEALASRDAARPDPLPPSAWTRLVALERMGLTPAIRSDLHRLTLLWSHGGVYLDADVVVLRPFRPLLRERGFTGQEQICFPMRVKGGRNPLRWVQGGLLTALRAGISAGFRHPREPFRRVERLHFQEPMGAVMGAEARHPVVRALIERAVTLSDAEARRPNRIGPWLFQEVVGNCQRPGFRLLDPHVVYPYPPEINVELIRPDPEGRLAITDPETVAAHLWDSVFKSRLGHAVDPAYLARTRGQTLLTRLAEPYLDDLLRLGGA
jgi:hypothetical protein